jgi:hypothetical protein
MTAQTTPVDGIVFLKDAVNFWAFPSVKQISPGLPHPSIEIFYGLTYGQSVPHLKRFVTRGTIETTEVSVAMFVGKFEAADQVSTYAYPPVGTYQFDPVALIPAAIKDVIFIQQDQYEMDFDKFIAGLPADYQQASQTYSRYW